MGCKNRINGHMTNTLSEPLMIATIHPYSEVLRVQNLAS